ncbi:MAG TPA: DivIVA domain-containing protein [Actinomycetota bacterium]|nr:DivIVA domain-containing protein [Actinomycetota bacterium]
MRGRNRRGRDVERSFRDERRAAEAGGEPRRLLPQDVQEKRFHLAFRGYNEREVDEFLDLVTEELARLHAENRRLRDELRALRAAGGRAREPVADATLARAQEEAARIVAQARAQARQVLAEAQARAVRLGRPGLPAEVAVFLAREKEFLRALAGLLQSHAEGLKQEVRRLRQAPAGPPAAGPTPSAPASAGSTAPAPASATEAPAERPIPEEAGVPVGPPGEAAGEPEEPGAGEAVREPLGEAGGAPERAAGEEAASEGAVREQAPGGGPGTAGGPPQGPEEDEEDDEEEERSLRELFWGEA